MSIPHVIRFVWTGRRFPYHARLAVESVLLAEPGAQVVLHTFGAAPVAARHWERTLQYERVSHDEVDLHAIFDGLPRQATDFVDLFGRIPSGAASAQSNLVRLGLLHQLGGVYLDFDVVMLRPLGALLGHEAFVGAELALRVDHDIQTARTELRGGVVDRGRAVGRLLRATPAVLAHTAARATRRAASAVAHAADPAPAILGALDRVWGGEELNNAVIGAAPRNPWIARTLLLALESSPTVRYALGPALVNRSVAQDDSHVTRLPPAYFYPVPPSRSFAFFECRDVPIPEETRLLHYVSSNHGKLLARLDEDEVHARRSQGLFWAEASRVSDAARGLALKPVPFAPPAA